MSAKRVAGLLLLCLLGGCGERPSFPTATPDEVSATRVTEEDIAIYDALVEAYAAEGCLLGYPPSPSPAKPLTLDEVEKKSAEEHTFLYDHTMGVGERQLAPEGWTTLDEKRRVRIDVPSDALADLLQRNSRPALLKNGPRHLRYKRTDYGMGSPLSGAVLSLSLAGFSARRDEALVEVGISTSGLSGGREMHYLRKIGGRWRVIAKQQTLIS